MKGDVCIYSNIAIKCHVQYHVEFFEDADKTAPVRDFLDSIPKKHRGKVLRLVTLLGEEGLSLGYPHSSQVDGRLRELRTRFANSNYRVLYYCDIERDFVLLHALRKTTSKLTQGDKAIGLARMEIDMKKKGNK